MRNDIHSAIQIANVVAFSPHRFGSPIREIGLFLQYAGIICFNSLPACIESATSLSNFQILIIEALLFVILIL